MFLKYSITLRCRLVARSSGKKGSRRRLIIELNLLFKIHTQVTVIVHKEKGDREGERGRERERERERETDNAEELYKYRKKIHLTLPFNIHTNALNLKFKRNSWYKRRKKDRKKDWRYSRSFEVRINATFCFKLTHPTYVIVWKNMVTRQPCI